MFNEQENVSITNEQNEPDVSNIEENNKIKNNKKMVSFISVFLVLVLLLGGGFYFYFSKPSYIVKRIINHGFTSARDLVTDTKNFDYEKDSMLVTGDLKVKTNMDELEFINNLSMDYNFGLDYSNNKMQFGGKLTENKTKLIDAVIYLLNDKAYLSLGDDYKNLINVDSKEFDFSEILNIEETNISTKDIDYILKELNPIVVDSLNMNKIKKSKATIKVDGKDVKVTKLTYDLNEKNGTEFINNFSKNMLKNKKLIAKLADITETDEEDITDALESLKDEEMSEVGTLNFYVKGITNKLVGLELTQDENKVGFKVGKTTKIYYEDGKNTIEFDVKDYSDKKVNIDYNININGQVVKGNLTATASKKNKNYTGTISFTIDVQGLNVTVTSNYKTEIGAKISDINTAKAVDLSDMSETDLSKIYTTITERLSDSEIFGSLSSLSGLLDLGSYDSDDYDSDDYDDNYNYDYDLDDDDDYDYDYDFDLE